jgi:hypothetical protein
MSRYRNLEVMRWAQDVNIEETVDEEEIAENEVEEDDEEYEEYEEYEEDEKEMKEENIFKDFFK